MEGTPYIMFYKILPKLKSDFNGKFRVEGRFPINCKSYYLAT